MSAFVINQLIP